MATDSDTTKSARQSSARSAVADMACGQAPTLDQTEDLVMYSKTVRELEGPCEVWEVPHGCNTRYGPHGYLRYIGKFPPQIPRQLIEEYSLRDDVILDPMVGGGTTLTEAMFAGRPKAIGYDVNVVALTIAKAATSIYDPDKLRRAADRIINQFRSATDSADSLFSPSRAESVAVTVPELFGNEKFFTDQALRELTYLKQLIDKLRNRSEQAFFLTCFFDILRRTSRCNVKKMNIELDENKQKIWSVGELYPRVVDRNLRLHNEFLELLPRNRCDVIIHQRDARTFAEPPGSIGLVLAHPPYMSNTAFSESTQLQLAFMGIPHREVWKKELRHRGSYMHETNGVRKYLVGWCKIIREAAAALRTKGHFAAVVGDGQVDTVRIPVGRITEEFCRDAGLSIVRTAEHLLNNNTGRTLNKKMKTQHIVVAQKI